jgi:type VI secretion system protein ImpH
MPVRDAALAFYGGLFAARSRSASGLEQLLSDFFGVPVEAEQFVGAWYRVPMPLQCRIDDEPDPTVIGLGDGTVLGDEIWDAQGRVRLRIGPLTREQYDDFLPGGAGHAALRALTRFYSDGDLDFEAQLVLDRDDVSGIVLGAEAEAGSATLGWCSWIRTRAFGRDADETRLTL